MKFDFQDTAHRIVRYGAKPGIHTQWRNAWIDFKDDITDIENHLIKPQFQDIPTAEAVIKATDIRFEPGHGPIDINMYCGHHDCISLMPKRLFKNATGYYATAFHELGHATGHQERLGRETLLNGGDGDNYNIEEITAQFASEYVMNTLGIDDTERSAAYIFMYASACKDPSAAIIQGALQASKAAEFILNKAY